MIGIRVVPAAGLLLVAGCSRLGRGGSVEPLPPPLPGLSYRADSAASDTLAPGVIHHSYTVRTIPWAIHVVEVDRAACWSLSAIKASGEAVGRTRTSDMVERTGRELAVAGRIVAAAVNADFFSFTPPGVPTGASVHDGRVVTGPGPRPVVASDSAGRPWIGTLGVWGRIISGADTVPISTWNRRSSDGAAFFDSAYGASIDTAAGSLRIVLGPGRRRRIVSVDSSGAAVVIPGQGAVISVGAGAPTGLRRRVLEAAVKTVPVEVAVGLLPLHPREAVGGFPVLVRDSAEVDGLDAAGGVNFGPVRHPRTMVGIGAAGRRLLLVTVDGRQEGYSAGMTLREGAQLLRDLGATVALNLDGGGSTTMVVRRAWENSVRYLVANHPSDKEGERPVGNALAIVSNGSECPMRR